MNKLKSLIITLMVMSLTFVCSSNAFADASDLNRINVTASAHMEVAPNIAYIEFNVVGRGVDADAAVAESASKMDAVRRALLGENILREEIVTTSYYLSPQYNNKMKIVGYSANNNIQVKVKNINKVGSVIDKITGAGVDTINNISFDISNKEMYQNTLLAQAVQNARKQAAVVANAGGRQLGNLLCATISNYNNYERRYSNVMLMKAEGLGEKAPETEIEAKNITLRANADVSFSLQ